IFALIPLTLQITGTYVQTTFVKNGLNLVAAAAVPAVLAGWLDADGSIAQRLTTRDGVRLLLWTPVIVAGLLLVCYGAAAYGLGSYPPARAQVVPQYFMVAGLAAWGFALGSLVRRAGLGRLLGREAQVWRAAAAGLLAVSGGRALWAAGQ